MQKKFTLNDILQFEQRYRATFINSIGGFKNVALIGTISNSGKTNLAIFNSLFHLGATPPLFGFIIRPDSVERHTLTNILSTKQFTVNYISENFYQQAHQTSARYNSDTSEFDATGLTPEYKTETIAPFVKESSIQISAEFIRKIEIVENGTLMLVAKMSSIFLPENCIEEDGFVDIEKAGTITCNGLDSYYSTKKIARLTYAKPNVSNSEII